MGEHALHPEEDTLEVHVDHAIPVRFGDVDERRDRDRAGVVDEVVDSAEFRDSLAHERSNVVLA